MGWELYIGRTEMEWQLYIGRTEMGWQLYIGRTEMGRYIRCRRGGSIHALSGDFEGNSLVQ